MLPCWENFCRINEVAAGGNLIKQKYYKLNKAWKYKKIRTSMGFEPLTRLNYQPLFGKMSPDLGPDLRERRKSSLTLDLIMAVQCSNQLSYKDYSEGFEPGNDSQCDRPGEGSPEKDCCRWQWLTLWQPEQKSSSESSERVVCQSNVISLVRGNWLFSFAMMPITSQQNWPISFHETTTLDKLCWTMPKNIKSWPKTYKNSFLHPIPPFNVGK